MYIVAILAATAVMIGVEYAGYSIIFRNFRERFREFYPEQERRPGWVLLGFFIFAACFVQLYSLNFIGTGQIVGMKFGLVTGALASVPRLLMDRSRKGIIWEYEIMFPILTIAECMVAGVVVGWLFS